MNFVLFIINAVTIALIAALMAVTPIINRKSLLFGVRVPEAAGDLPEVRRLKRDYISITGIGCLVVLAAAALQYIFAPQYTLLAMLYFPFVMMGLEFAAYYPQWKKAGALKEDRGWQTPLTGAAETRSAADRERLSSLPWAWYIASAALVLMLTAWTLAIYPSLPDQIIMNWGMDMEPGAWVDKTIFNVILMPLIAFGTIAIMAGSNVVFYRQKLQISAEHPALSFAQHKLYRRMMSHALGFLTLCMALMFAGLHPPSIGVFVPSGWYIPALIIVATALGFIPVIYVPIRAGQSGCRLKPAVSEEDMRGEELSAKAKTAHPGRGDDKYWKLGKFYCNPDDPAMLVEDRFGGNGGFNYSRLPGKLFVAGIAAVIIATYAVITYVALTNPAAFS